MTREGNTPMDVLLVEDSLGDIRLTLEIFRDANPAARLHVTKDGAEAMAFLRREGGMPKLLARSSYCWI